MRIAGPIAAADLSSEAVLHLKLVRFPHRPIAKPHRGVPRVYGQDLTRDRLAHRLEPRVSANFVERLASSWVHESSLLRPRIEASTARPALPGYRLLGLVAGGAGIRSC